MAEHSTIEWTDATWNPITGCTMVSAGCTNCYAMGLAATRLRHHPSRAGLTRMTGGRAVWTGEVRLNDQWLDQPLGWARPRRIFVCAHGDLFHEAVPDEWIDRVFAIMALAPRHTFQVLTKRPERARAYLSELQRRITVSAHTVQLGTGVLGADVVDLTPWPLPNVWLGTSIEDQATADARIPDLLATPAAIRFVSAEPLLGPVDLESAWHEESALEGDCWGACGWCDEGRPPLHNCIRARQSDQEAHRSRSGLDWVIVGGESGPKARPMHPDWARALRDQCQAAGVAFLFKQWGAWSPLSEDADWGRDWMLLHADGDHDLPDGRAPAYELGEIAIRHVGKTAAGRLLDGRTWDEVPA